jgi:hypothetical protein
MTLESPSSYDPSVGFLRRCARRADVAFLRFQNGDHVLSSALAGATVGANVAAMVTMALGADPLVVAGGLSSSLLLGGWGGARLCRCSAERRQRGALIASVAAFGKSEGHPDPWGMADAVWRASVAQGRADVLWAAAAAQCAREVPRFNGVSFVGPTTNQFRRGLSDARRFVPDELWSFLQARGVSLHAGRTLSDVVPTVISDRLLLQKISDNHSVASVHAFYLPATGDIFVAEYQQVAKESGNWSPGKAWQTEVEQGLWLRSPSDGFEYPYINEMLCHEVAHALSSKSTPIFGTRVSDLEGFRRAFWCDRMTSVPRSEDALGNLGKGSYIRLLDNTPRAMEETFATVASSSLLPVNLLSRDAWVVRNRLYPLCAAFADMFMYDCVKALGEDPNRLRSRLDWVYQKPYDLMRQAYCLPRSADGRIQFPMRNAGDSSIDTLLLQVMEP